LHSLPFGRTCRLWPLLLHHFIVRKTRSPAELLALAHQKVIYLILRCAVESRCHPLTYDDSRTNSIQNPL
ncbi:hypothetical protein PENTCL1PPCAC_26014, partial [Pristionchus entomophagus]